MSFKKYKLELTHMSVNHSMENKIVASDFLNAYIIELFANCSMKIHLKKICLSYIF